MMMISNVLLLAYILSKQITSTSSNGKIKKGVSVMLIKQFLVGWKRLLCLEWLPKKPPAR